MAEVVTSNAASQLNLLAHRQQDVSVERNSGAGSLAVPQNTQEIRKPAAAEASNSSENQQNRERQQSERRSSAEIERAPASGPSKPRIELKQIDFGLTPAEIVGTVDVLQRFDDNGDGRVDLLESQQAQLSRSDGVTFSGLAAAPVKSEVSPQPTELLSVNTASPQPAVNRVFAGGDPVFGEPAAVTEKKFFKDEEAASLGAPTGTEDAPRKFYGQGAEVVLGQFAAATDATPKYSDKVTDARSEGAVSEDGTGETKYYDKVAQAENGQSFGEAPGEGDRSYHEKAQQIASATNSAEGATEQKKFVHTELSAYSVVADVTGSGDLVTTGGPRIITA